MNGLRRISVDVYVNVNYDSSAMPVVAPAAPQTQRDPQRIYSIAELAREFGIEDEHRIATSYSDLLLVERSSCG